MSKYIWCEDTGAGYEFWHEITDVIDSDIKVESKGNNTELRKAVEHISADKDDYYVIMDMPIDNQDTLREAGRLKKIAARKNNVHIVKIHSFEGVLLSFELFEKWIFTECDDLKVKRKDLLVARELFLKMIMEAIDIEGYSEIFNLTGYSKDKNSEKIAASLLYDITRNTGFETNKSNLGKCFVNDCCTWNSRQDDDICGLDQDRLSSKLKKNMLIHRSMLHAPLKEVGLI